MSDSIEPIVIEAWLADSPRFADGKRTLPGINDPVIEAAKWFNQAHPEYEVRVRQIDFRAMPEEVGAAAAAGNPPDLVEYIYSSTQTAHDTRTRTGAPLFASVQAAIGDRTKILGEPVVVDDLLPVVRNYYSQAGELFSMPTVVTTNMLYANKGMLDRAGIARMPTTWEELAEACDAIAALPGAPAHRVSWPIYGWLFHQEIAGQGGLFGNAGNGRTGRTTKLHLDSPEMLNYVRYWKAMHESGHYLYTGQPRDYFSPMAAFERGEIAFVISSSAVGITMVDMAAKAGIELLVGGLPRSDARRSPGGPIAGQSFFMAGGLPKEKEDGALAFLQYQLNPALAAARMTERTLPITRQAHELSLSSAWKEPFPGFLTASHQVNSAEVSPTSAGPRIGNLHGINTLVTYAMEDVLLRNVDPATRFQEVNEKAQLLLDHHNAAALAYPPVTPEVLRGG